MQIKRGIVYLVLLILILPYVNPARTDEDRSGFPSSPYREGGSSEITCPDGTFLGYCNEQGQFCGSIENLIGAGNFVNLNQGIYIFTGILESACPADFYKLVLGRDEIRLVPTVRNGKIRVTAEFTSKSPFSGNIQLKCYDNSNIEFKKSLRGYEVKYLGEKGSLPALSQDCNLCKCNEEELELMENCVSHCNFSLCEELPDSHAKQSIIDQYAIECNDAQKCSDSICSQKVVAFNCHRDCDFLFSMELNPDFSSGRKIFVRNNNDNELKRFRLDDEGRNRNRCDIQLRDYTGEGFIDRILSGNPEYFDTHATVLYGAVIPRNDGAKFSDYIQEKLKFREAVLEGERECVSYFCRDIFNLPFGSSISIKKDCSNDNCPLLKPLQDGTEQPNGVNLILGLRGDLLCGYDDYWYLCDRGGIKSFDNGKKYLCDGNSGTWIKIN